MDTISKIQAERSFLHKELFSGKYRKRVVALKTRYKRSKKLSQKEIKQFLNE